MGLRQVKNDLVFCFALCIVVVRYTQWLSKNSAIKNLHTSSCGTFLPQRLKSKVLKIFAGLFGAAAAPFEKITKII